MSVFVQQCGSLCEFSSSDSWVILSPIEQSIKRKIEAVGTPLKDWDIQINYGIKTGFNDAFIINTEKRDEILANCHTDEERSRTAELIRPILRGRDIKRYGYEWAKLWLINTHNGVKGKFERIHIEDFPAVKAHLDQYWDKISKRADKGDTPYNLRNCAYMEDFLQPKIVWKRVGSILRFSYNENGAMALDSTCFATGKDIKFLVGILNSKMGHYLLKDAPKTGTGDLLISVQAVEPLKIPILNKGIKEELEVLLNKQLYSVSKERDKEINRIVFKLYGLLDEEIIFIENSL
ncbi:TaqI-like C-terminal specificity domain-containing protein [Parabacteroides gordonii]|uniref:TaqI-like C-terminal specificity domain-containing protein n=1 Tax=Parabacteroides gordonii TaxID=574930 RepID=UPI0026EEAF51|nr:TaqI-like C-terminal specificity domain-containing protein [Parabacteroides gordonii]